MSELRKINAEIRRLKIQQARAAKLSRAKGQVRELKYGKYLKPGRRAVKAVKRYVTTKPSVGGGFDMGLSGGFGSNPLEGIGDGFGGISMGNPFGEPERRSSPRKHRKKTKVRIVYRSRPRRRRYYYR